MCCGQLHFEDSFAPRGTNGGGTDYRPDGTPTKVGLWMLMVRGRCMCYLPGNYMSYDEGTAKYGGRMTRYKHRQQHKPYDGIRIYMLNDSLTGIIEFVLFVTDVLLCCLLENSSFADLFFVRVCFQ